MAIELEGLIARLLLVISCAGEQGLSISDFNDAAKLALCLSDSAASLHNNQDGALQDSRSKFSDHAVATIWRWLVRRADISIGPDRKLNQLMFSEVLALHHLNNSRSARPGLDFVNSNANAQQAVASSASRPSERNDIRIYASQEMMWEAITGHAIDYKRVPRSEWLLLLGIASTKAKGILQGDLGRLVDQDKRSVPKRTDALVKKGYITKRTTLVRGTKTSKMWLKLFAPPLPKDRSAAAEPEAEMNLSRQVLAINLDAVPWHTRWTGESVDYTALATTIMAICKEWGVLRMQDLKSKLGVLGMRWQMKVVSKVCRFLNARDAIRYVAAKLNNKVFNDCVQFNRDLTPKDWSIFLATGKRAGKVARTSEFYSQDGHDVADPFFNKTASSKCLGVAPTWSMDQPLAATITKNIMSCGEAGLTNPDVYGLTLGVSFTRFLSSLTTCISTPNIQPAQLQHLQVRSEHSRAGKVASYRYSLPPLLPQDTPWVLQSSDAMSTNIEQQDHERRTDSRLFYGFSQESHPIGSSKLANLSQANLSQRRQRGRPRKIRPEPQNDRSGDDSNLQQTSDVAHPEANLTKEDDFVARAAMIIKLKVPQDALRELMNPLLRPQVAGQETDVPEPEPATTKATSNAPLRDTITCMNTTLSPDSRMPRESPGSVSRGRGRGRGRASGRLSNNGRAGSFSNDAAKRKGWQCDKCGRTWKNDIGLKYHLEKSQTSCNPSYNPSNIDGFRREIKSAPRLTSGTKSNESFTAEPASSTRVSHRADRPKTAEEREKEQDGAETSIFGLSPTRTRPRVDKYSHNPISPAAPSQPEEIYGLNQSSNDQSISKHRSTLNLSSLPQEQITVLRVDVKQSSQMLGLKNRKSNANQLENLSITESSLNQSGRHSSVTSVLEEIEVQKNRDEYGKPDHETPGQAYSIGNVETGIVSSQPSSGTVPGNLGSEGSKKRPLRSEITDQISALLMDMLVQRDGVLPGGHSLWHALTTMWTARHPEKPVPKTKDYQGALSRMIKAKSVLEHWHGFQDHSGLFSKCQIITLPHLDAFSAEALAVVENIKQRHPQLFIPTQFRSLSNDVESGERRENRRGRRILAGEVAQLDAPVYAAQSSAKRRHGMMSDATTPSKRRKYTQASANSPNLASLSTPPHEKYRVRWASNNWLSEKIDVSSQNNRSMAHTAHEVKIQFLAPNLFLEDDWSVSDHGVPQGITRSYRFNDTNVTLQGSPTALAAKVNITEPVQILGNDGNWPYLELQFFEEKSTNSSFTLCGWMPDAEWFHWADMVQGLDKRTSTNEMGRQSCTVSTEAAHDRFIKGLIDCLDFELTQGEQFINAPPLVAGPYNLFVNFSAGSESVPSLPGLKWQHQEQLNAQTVEGHLYESDALPSSDEDSEFGLDTSVLRYSRRPWTANEMAQSKVKRVALITRPLTSISQRGKYRMDEPRALEMEDGQMASQGDLLAAFVIVRVLLGGADKAIDWGLLLHIFPNMRLAGLRKFWAAACKEQGPYIKKFTRDVQERLIEALESREVPMVDFEDPIEYDWQMLIKWATRISRQEGYQIPQTRELLAHRFLLKANRSSEEDWCERYFHAQSSIFSRFEAVTSEPGALPVNRVFDLVDDNTDAENADIARSWIKSLCCTGEAKYSVRKIKEKFLTLSREGTEQGSLLLKEAIDQLTAQRVICRSKKTPLGGRPYRLSEWYLSTLSRVAQRSKYEEAAAFKKRMDAIFRTREAFEIPYTLNDGSMMALTNLNATGRITLVPLDIPNIPFGFEPGNYESRKYPKSYYHFRLQAVPTDLYQYSNDIAVLQAVTHEDLPSTTLKGEIPQWIDFFGDKDSKRWSDILGAICFTYATKGPMAIRDVCNSLRPILDEFEAKLIVNWGIKTGVFEEAMGGLAVTVGEWWWLAVPWQYSRQWEQAGSKQTILPRRGPL
ncbi:hypothetical protein V8C42DRAFT_313668 [Trichoderma barbatum]